MNIFGQELKKLPAHVKRRVIMELGRVSRRIRVEFARHPTRFGKTDLVHFISRRLDLTNYLELCTSTTGLYYGGIFRWRFNTARRLMYNCPDNFNDGLPVDFRIADFDIGPALGKLKTDPNKIDICLVDGFHTYDCATRDLNCAFDLLPEGGVLVVHDCLPPSELVASPTFKLGGWAGVTYKAYLDFVLARDDLDYCTVDVDWGCGIIVKNRKMNFLASSPRDSNSASEWFSVHKDDKVVFEFFLQNSKQLLRLISAKTFVRGFGHFKIV
jgi:hypothetical protein